MSTFTLLSITFMLLSMPRVTFNTSAVAIFASSRVSLSSLFKASSTSFLPSSFFRNFSKKTMSQDSKIAGDELTPSPLFDLHCHNREDREHFYHDFHHHVRHCLRWF